MNELKKIVTDSILSMHNNIYIVDYDGLCKVRNNTITLFEFEIKNDIMFVKNCYSNVFDIFRRENTNFQIDVYDPLFLDKLYELCDRRNTYVNTDIIICNIAYAIALLVIIVVFARIVLTLLRALYG